MSTITLDPKTVTNRYSVGQFASDFASMAKSPDGAPDVIEAVINACDWMSHLGIYKEMAQETSSTLEPIGQGFAIGGFIHHVNALRDQVRSYEVNDPSQLKKEVFENAAFVVKDGAKMAMFFNSTGIYVFKEGVKSIKTVFWMALGVFSVVDLYNKVGATKEYNIQLDQVKEEEHREILRSKLNLTYLQVIQGVTLVAMSAIALVSLVFASMAKGLLFNPEVMLGLSSAWLVLQFVTYFYDKIITHRETNLNRTLA